MIKNYDLKAVSRGQAQDYAKAKDAEKAEAQAEADDA